MNEDWTPAKINFLIDQLRIESLTYKEIIDSFFEKYRYERRSRDDINKKILEIVKEYPDLDRNWLPDKINFLKEQLKDKTLRYTEIIDSFFNEYGDERRSRNAIKMKIIQLVQKNPDLRRPKLSCIPWTKLEENFIRKQLNKNIKPPTIIDNFFKKFKNTERSRNAIRDKIYKLKNPEISKLIEENPDLYRKKVWTKVEEDFIREQLNKNTTPHTIIHNFIEKFGYEKRTRRGIEEKIKRLRIKTTPKNNQTGNGNTSLGNINPMSRTSTSTSKPFNNYPFISNKDLQQNMNQVNSQNYDPDINNMINLKRKRTTSENNQTGHINPMLNTTTNNHFNISQSNRNDELLNPKRHKGTTNTMSSQTNTTRNRTGNNTLPPYNNTLPPYNNNSSLPYMVQQSSNIYNLIGMANEIYKENRNNNEKDNIVFQKSDPVNRLGNINYNQSPIP